MTKKKTDRLCELERSVLQTAKIASEMGLHDMFKLVHVRTIFMAKKLNHRFNGALNSATLKDQDGRTVRYAIREKTTPMWQLIALNAGDEKRLELFLNNLSKAKGGIYFGVFQDLKLISVKKISVKPVLVELLDQFNRPRKFKNRTSRSRVNLSIGENFLEYHDKDIESVFP